MCGLFGKQKHAERISQTSLLPHDVQFWKKAFTADDILKQQIIALFPYK